MSAVALDRPAGPNTDAMLTQQWRPLTADPAIAELLRGWVAETLHVWDRQELHDDVALIMTELFANAAARGRGGVVRTGLQLWSHGVRCWVWDSCPEPPTLKPLLDLTMLDDLDVADLETGRGLHIVESLVGGPENWGFEVQPKGIGGKTVWAFLSFP